MGDNTPDRVAEAAKCVAAFDGSIESAQQTLQSLGAIRLTVTSQLEILQKENEVVESLIQYIQMKRNEAVHGTSTQIRGLEAARVQRTKARSRVANAVLHLDGAKVLDTQEERVQETANAAMQLVEDGYRTFTVDQIHEYLTNAKIDLGVSQPTSVIGTILNGDERFSKLGSGQYMYGRRRSRIAE